MVSVFGLPPLAPNRPLPRAIFDGICDVLCTSSTPQKRAGFLPRGGGSAAPARLPIAKAKATPHAMRSNMPGIRCLVHRRIEGLPPMPPTPKTGGSKRCFAERESNFFYFQTSGFFWFFWQKTTKFWDVLRCCWSLRSLGWYADTDFTRKILFLKKLHSTDATRPLIFVAHVDMLVPFCLWKSVDFCIIYQALHFTPFLWWPWW